MMCRKVCKL